MSEEETPEFLYRYGREPESLEELREQAARASAAGFPHGISATSRARRPDAVAAPYVDVSRWFAVHRTGKTRYHYTIELPEPLTREAVARFNRLFGRGE